MNRIIRSRLTGIAVVLLLVVLSGCQQLCFSEICVPVCVMLMPPDFNHPFDPWIFLGGCCLGCAGLCREVFPLFFTDNSAECAATFEYYQDAAIQLCQEYPEECQEYFDAWVASLDEEAIQ